jgi:hypothetical protein
MAAKKRLRMRGVKQASRRLEEEILERSQKIADNPGLLRPLCAGNCRKCVFDKEFKNIDSIAKYKGNAEVLMKLASKGSDDLGKAYAGTISLSAAGKIPMLATATIAGEKVPFAVRGSVGNDKLIGCQYYDDPRLRLMYYNTFIKKNKLHLYSFEEGLVCSDRPNMPEDYLYEVFWDTPYEFKDDSLDCGHRGALSLDIRIKSLDEHICICEDCAKDVSTIQYLISRLCAVDPLDDVEVNVVHAYHSANESDKEKIEGDLFKRYLRGEVSDRTLLQTVKRDKLGTLHKGDIATFIISAKNYGSDVDVFMDSVIGPESERKTLRAFLKDRPTSVVIRNGKTSEILSVLWDDNWKDIIAVHTSQKIAESYTVRPKTPPSQVLEEAYDMHISADVVASLPEFRKPKQVTRFSDTLAKAAKVGGEELVNKTLGSESLKDHKSKSLAAAFLLACNPNAKLPFTLTADEKDFTNFLIPFTKNVIDSNGEKYRDAMNTLLTACSSGESV